MLPVRRLAWCLLSVLAAPVQGQGPLERFQREDGGWASVAQGAKPEAELRVHALMMLAVLGDGSTSRSGPLRDVARRGLGWLLARQDPHGRFAPRADPAWLLDQAMGTLVLAEELRLSRRLRATLPPLSSAVTALVMALSVARPAADVEVQLWARMVVDSLRATAGNHGAAWSGVVAVQIRDLADLLANMLALQPDSASQTVRQAAAARLLCLVREPAAAFGPLPPVPGIEDPLRDPLHGCYAIWGVWRRGGAAWRSTTAVLERQVVRTQVSRQAEDPGVRGTWNPVGAFGEEYGRLGTTAGAMLLMECYYRYCALQVCSDG